MCYIFGSWYNFFDNFYQFLCTKPNQCKYDQVLIFLQYTVHTYVNWIYIKKMTLSVLCEIWIPVNCTNSLKGSENTFPKP